MPPRRQNRNPIPDAHSEEVDNNHQQVSEEEIHQQGPHQEEPFVPGQFARELAASMLEASRNMAAPTGHHVDCTFEALCEFWRMNPPKFSGQEEPLVADHWLIEIRRIFDTLGIHEDKLRITFATYQLTGEAVPWWSSIVEMRRSSLVAGEVDPIGSMTWDEFVHVFENQYFPECYKDQLREQFEHLEQGTMSVSQYTLRFQSLSRFATDLVSSEERRCKRFEKGLHPSIQHTVMGHRLRVFTEIIDCARAVEPKRDV